MVKTPKKAVKKAPKKQSGKPALKTEAKKTEAKKIEAKKIEAKKIEAKKIGAKKAGPKKANSKKAGVKQGPAGSDAAGAPLLPRALLAPTGEVLDRLHGVVLSRRNADPTLSHSARLLSRGPAKVAQKFGEEAVEAVIEAVSGNKPALIGESADVLYHLLVLWVAAGVEPAEVWAELQRREGVSGVVEKASRLRKLPTLVGTTKIP